jgi:hypothetical protein
MHGRSFGLQQRVARRAGFLLPPTVVGSVFEERLAAAAADPASHPTRGPGGSSSVTAGSALHYAPLVPASFIAQGERHVSVDRWLDGVPRFAFARVPPAIFSLRPMQGVRTLVAMIGEQTFAAHCTTRDPDDDPDVTHLAWHAAWDNLDVTPVAPSPSLIDAARRFARGMQLGCVVIDVLSTNDGDHFLRADPQAGLTILQDAGIPVVDEIVTRLAGAGTGDLR